MKSCGKNCIVLEYFHVYLYIFYFQVKEAKIRAVHLTTKRIIHLQKAAFLEEKKIFTNLLKCFEGRIVVERNYIVLE